MKQTSRLILRIFLIFLVSTMLFTSCQQKAPIPSNSSDDAIETTPGDNTPEDSQPIEELLYELPEKQDLSVDGDPYIYRAYVRSNYDSPNTMEDGNPAFYCEDFWVPMLSNLPDALEYAVYSRNLEIEETYNVKIKQVPQTGNMVAELRAFYQNGDTFDLTIILAKSAAQAATENLLRDIRSMEHIDLSHEAYDQNSIRELSMGGKLYYLSGDMNISTMDCAGSTAVNLTIYEDLTEAIIELFDNDTMWADIYNIVKTKKWTMENMLKIVEIATVDADTTDGDLGNSPEDRLGYCQYATDTLGFFYGAGGRISNINEEGYPEFVIQDQDNQDIFDYLFANFNKYNSNLGIPYGWSGLINGNFMDKGNTLFVGMGFWTARKILYEKGTFPYGFLPTPLYEEGDDYHSFVYFYNTVHLWAIPNLVGDEYRSQVMLQILAAYSNVEKPGSTMDAYYTRTLYFSIAGPEPGSRDVMSIIKDSIVYDIAVLYNWGGWVNALQTLGEKTYNEYASLVDQLHSTAEPQLEATIDAFKNPEALPERK